MVTAARKLKDTCSLEEKLWKCWQHIKNQRHDFTYKGPYSQSYGFSSSHVWMWELNQKDWESFGQQADETSSSKRKSTLDIHWKDWCWSSSTLASHKELTHWKRLWCWERWKTGREGGDKGWDGWMASWTQWTWTWANSGKWWRTGDLACCSPWCHRVRHDLGTEQHSFFHRGCTNLHSHQCYRRVPLPRRRYFWQTRITLMAEKEAISFILHWEM